MIIRAHSVPMLPPDGLSPMQERLLRSEKPVRLVSAPTGSGKSYAFMRAVLDEDARVLFIVPTKRLLQNLIKEARGQAGECLRRRGLDDTQVRAWIDERIIEWSGNQAKDGHVSLSGTRVRQFLDGGAHSGGRVIFAIPEVVVTMISGIRLMGASAVNPFLYVRRFDHLVFDEFHTIDDRSFGLACLFSRLAVMERKGKVSLLSATPIDVTRVLERIGVGQEDTERMAEQIVDGHAPDHRPVHGNVEIEVHDHPVVESIELNRDAIRSSIAHGFTVIVIYDSLKQLKREEDTVRSTLMGAGVSGDRILTINSIDDSRRRPGETRRGRKYEDPGEYDALLCTSSVEIGVTFRSTLMFTEPGHRLASFVQRVGRVSRGADDGRVVVSLSRQRRNRHSWVRRIGDVVESHTEVDMQTFVDEILRDDRRRLEPTRKETEADVAMVGTDVPFYRRASWRGAFWAALFVIAVRETKMDVQKAARDRLRGISSGVTKFVEAKIGEILSVHIVNDNLRNHSQPHRQWVNALFTSALTYRDIGATVVVADPDGTRRTASESFLRRATDILSRYIAICEDGEQIVYLKSRTLDDEIKASPERRELQRMTLYVPSPIGEGNFSLLIREQDKGTEHLNVRLIEEWQDRFRRFIPRPEERTNDPRKKVMGAATALVEKLGRPPFDEDYEDSGESALFA